MTQTATKQIELGLPEAPVIVPGANKHYQVDPDANMAAQ
jgi:nitrate reductase cytochrome c-type subunit